MYERILVAVDGSATSQAVLDHAAALAREQGAELVLVHVVDELGVGLGPTHTPADFWTAARAAGERILAESAQRAEKAGARVQSSLVENRTLGAVIRRVAERIVEEAKRWRADLVVIGTHGRRGFATLLLGSVAEGVLRSSPVPVLLIRGSKPRSGS